MGISAFLAIGFGAAFGAWLRWGLGLWLNPVFPTLPYGTLAANLLGGYLVGIAIAYFVQHPGLPPEWRLFAITGFLGGLTTFSTFSAEAVALLQQRDYLAVMLHTGTHLLGSIALCIAGLATWRWLSA
jgi:CrcB protein